MLLKRLLRHFTRAKEADPRSSVQAAYGSDEWDATLCERPYSTPVCLWVGDEAPLEDRLEQYHRMSGL